MVDLHTRSAPRPGKPSQLFKAEFGNFCLGISGGKVRASVLNLPLSPALPLPPSLPPPHPTAGWEATERASSLSPAPRSGELSHSSAPSQRGCGTAGVKVDARPRPHLSLARSRCAGTASCEKVAVSEGAAAMTTPAVAARARPDCSREEGGAESGGCR